MSVLKLAKIPKGKDAGFTLIESIISLAIVSVVVVGAAGALKLSSKSMAKVEHATKFKDFEPALASLLLKRTKQIIDVPTSSENACQLFTYPQMATWYGDSTNGWNYGDPAVNISLLDNPNQFDGFPNDLKRRCLRISVNADGEEGAPAGLPNIQTCPFPRFYSCYEIKAIDSAPDSFFAKNRVIAEIRFDLKNTDQNTDINFQQYSTQTNKAFKMYYSMHWSDINDPSGTSTSRNSATLTGFELNDMSAFDSPTSTGPVDDGSTNCTDGAFAGGVTSPRHYCLFASTLGYRAADLGGLQGADDKCNHLAGEGGLLNPAITWKAILSDNSTNAKDRILIDRAIYSTHKSSGTTFSGYLLAYANQFWSSPQNAPLVYNQYGIYDQYKEPETYHGNHTWTGTNSNGSKAGGNCSNWTSNYGYGLVGDASIGGSDSDRWRDGSKQWQPCANRHQIYCISQPK